MFQEDSAIYENVSENRSDRNAVITSAGQDTRVIEKESTV